MSGAWDCKGQGTVWLYYNMVSCLTFTHYGHSIVLTMDTPLFAGEGEVWSLFDEVKSGLIMCSTFATLLTHIEAGTRWTSFRRRQFRMHFLQWKLLYFD